MTEQRLTDRAAFEAWYRKTEYDEPLHWNPDNGPNGYTGYPRAMFWAWLAALLSADRGEPVAWASQKELDALAADKCVGITCGTHSERYGRTVPLYAAAPTPLMCSACGNQLPTGGCDPEKRCNAETP